MLALAFRSNQVQTIARLAPGVTIEDARRIVNEQTPAVAGPLRADVERLDVSPPSFAERDDAPLHLGLLAAALCLLLTACANVVSLASAVRRVKAFAVQLALGAPRASLARVVLLEGAFVVGYDSAMGLTYVEGNLQGWGRRRRRVRFLVDSGAVYSILRNSEWGALGLKPEREIEFALADGTTITRAVSECSFEIEGRRATFPVVLGESEEEALRGAVTLKTLGLVLNPLSRTLQRMRMVLAQSTAIEPRPKSSPRRRLDRRHSRPYTPGRGVS